MPPQRVHAPPTGNPGSATAVIHRSFLVLLRNIFTIEVISGDIYMTLRLCDILRCTSPEYLAEKYLLTTQSQTSSWSQISTS